MTPERRGQHPVLRFLLWFVAPFDDRLKGLSLARLLSIWCFSMVQDAVEHRPDHHIGGWDYAVLLLGAGLWVGKKAVLGLIARQETKALQADAHITQEIHQRREEATANGWPGRERA